MPTNPAADELREALESFIRYASYYGVLTPSIMSTTITVQVLSASGAPQVNRIVRATPRDAWLTVTAAARTNASGIATFTVTAGAPGGQSNLQFRPEGDNASLNVFVCAASC